tara:strand:+ start:535 stop:1053 length:519 start_codon:yes stop_codon:yes gene_type:complete
MKLKTLLGTVVAFVLGLTVGFAGKVAYEESVLKPWAWAPGDGPIIINCYGEDFPEIQIVKAIDYWVLRGESVAFYEMNPPEAVCANEHINDFIILRKAPPGYLNEATIAATTRRTQLFNMRSAVIHFRPGSYNLDLIIEHELGHAFGYGHIEEEGHIMHPQYNKMGPRWWIP